MGGEVRQFDDSLHEGYVYAEPEDKAQVDLTEAPEPEEDVTDEIEWHMDNLAYQTVELADGSDWSKEEVLKAIEEGHIDAFRVNQLRFPPTLAGEWITTFHPVRFDDRDFGERIANRVLYGHNRDPRS